MRIASTCRLVARTDQTPRQAQEFGFERPASKKDGSEIETKAGWFMLELRKPREPRRPP